MRWARKIARMEIRLVYEILEGNPQGRGHLGNIEVDWRAVIAQSV
jgi:hypothetical protein